MPASRSRIGVIFFTVLIDLIGFGIVLPILPFYAQRFGAAGLGYGAVVGVFSLMQFVATALLGRRSDVVGRRPVRLTTMVVTAVGYTLFAFAGSYWVLFISRVVSGFAGGNISAAQAYVADITTPAERSRGMGMIGAAFGIGFSLGPAIGGFAAHWGGPAAPGLVAVGLSVANFLSAYFILPESLGHELRVRRPMFDLRHIGEAIARPRLRPLMAVWALVPLGFAGYTVALPLRAAAVLGWRERELAILFTIIGDHGGVRAGILLWEDRPAHWGARPRHRRDGRYGDLNRGRSVSRDFGAAVRLDIRAGGFQQRLRTGSNRPGLHLCRPQRAGDRARRGAGHPRAGSHGRANPDRDRRRR